MTPKFDEWVTPVLHSALDLKDRLDRGETPGLDLEAEQRALLEGLRSEAEARRLPDYGGDGGAFLGARYALACWLDELFIGHSRWSDDWNARKIETALYGSNLRAAKFWEQLDIVLRRPGAPRVPNPPGPDAVEAFFLCVVLGFRGRHADNPAKVREYVEDLRSQIARASSWEAPNDHGVRTDVEPLAGRGALRRVVWLYGGLSLLAVLALLIVSQFT